LLIWKKSVKEYYFSKLIERFCIFFNLFSINLFSKSAKKSFNVESFNPLFKILISNPVGSNARYSLHFSFFFFWDAARNELNSSILASSVSAVFFVGLSLLKR